MRSWQWNAHKEKEGKWHNLTWLKYAADFFLLSVFGRCATTNALFRLLSWFPLSSLTLSQHFPAVSGAFMDSPYNGNTSLQTSSSNLNAGYSRPSEAEDDGKVSSDTIWLWIAVLATFGNIVVVAVVCVCAFWQMWEQKHGCCWVAGESVQPENIFSL